MRTFRSLLSLALFLAVLGAATMAFADPSKENWADVADRVLDQMPSGLALLTAGGFLGGAALFILGLGKSNTMGQHRGSNPLGGPQASWFGPMMSMLVGVALMFVSTAIYLTKNTGFGEDAETVNIQGIRQLDQ